MGSQFRQEPVGIGDAAEADICLLRAMLIPVVTVCENGSSGS